MYVDQEAAQDDDEQFRTSTNRPPTAGNDVSAFQQHPLFSFSNHFRLGSSNDSCYAPSSIHRSSSVKQRPSTWVLWEEYVHHYIWTTAGLNYSRFCSFFRTYSHHYWNLGRPELLRLDRSGSGRYQRCRLCDTIIQCSSSWYHCSTKQYQWRSNTRQVLLPTDD